MTKIDVDQIVDVVRSDKPAESIYHGFFVPMEAAGEPSILTLARTDQSYITIFSTPEKMRSFWSAIGLTFSHVGRIIDITVLFEAADEEGFHIIADPTLEGSRLRYERILWARTDVASA